MVLDSFAVQNYFFSRQFYYHNQDFLQELPHTHSSLALDRNEKSYFITEEFQDSPAHIQHYFVLASALQAQVPYQLPDLWIDAIFYKLHSFSNQASPSLLLSFESLIPRCIVAIAFHSNSVVFVNKGYNKRLFRLLFQHQIESRLLLFFEQEWALIESFIFLLFENAASSVVEVEEVHFYRFSVNWEHFSQLFSYLSPNPHGIFSITFDLILALDAWLLIFFFFAPPSAREVQPDTMLSYLLIFLRLRDQQQRDLFQKPVANPKQFLPQEYSTFSCSQKGHNNKLYLMLLVRKCHLCPS